MLRLKILGYKSQVLTTNGANPLVISEVIKRNHKGKISSHSSQRKCPIYQEFK